MQTVAENSASLALDRTVFTLRLHELENLLLNLTSLGNKQARYKLAEADISACKVPWEQQSSYLLLNRHVPLCDITYYSNMSMVTCYRDHVFVCVCARALAVIL